MAQGPVLQFAGGNLRAVTSRLIGRPAKQGRRQPLSLKSLLRTPRPIPYRPIRERVGPVRALAMYASTHTGGSGLGP